MKILFDDNGAALLADFGLNTISADLIAHPPAAITTPSAGTIRCMCPELSIDQSDPPCESDYDALGMVIVIYEVSRLQSSRRPFIYLPSCSDRPMAVPPVLLKQTMYYH